MADVPEPHFVQTLAVSTAKTSKYLSFSPSFQHLKFTTWIKDNIRKKECCYYVQDAREGICKCGYPKLHHADEAVKPEEFLGEPWDKCRHIREVPTNAFGDITFGGLGQKVGKYVRVSTNTSPEILYQLIIEQWRLHPPNLLISVTGGAKNFYMKARLKEMFRRGLIKVTQSTGAWILTGGTHTGVMKHVGMAVRDYTTSSSSAESQVVAIGVATWGVLHNRQPLVHPEGCFPAHYTLDEQGQGHLSCLDINHSHFLLVDDGTHGHYGVEIDLRSRLEKHISQQSLGRREGDVTIPVVCVVLNGGPGTLNTIYSSMLNGTPCVVLEGSGRLADVIAEVANLPMSRVTISLIHQLMKRFFGQEYEAFTKINIIEWTKKIQDIIRMPHLLTIFCINEKGHSDVDVAILQALLKASRSCDTPGHKSWERQLELAVAWNRVDIAESEIFREESQWKSSDLHPAMFSALVGHKAKFVKLLLENGVSLREFLDEETLCVLYAHMVPGCVFLRRLAKRIRGENGCRRQSDHPSGQRWVSLQHVSEEVRHFLGSFTKPLYPPLPHRNYVEMSEDDIQMTALSKGSEGLQGTSSAKEGMGTESLRDPGSDLFLWAILQNNKELAEILWEQCRDGITAALVASKILKKLAIEEEEEGNEAEDMRALANHYEQQAVGVFSECYAWNDQRAQKLLTRISPFWGRTTCLRLALEADDKSFVAHTGVQSLLTQMWCGELAVSNSSWKVLLCIPFTPLICTGLLTFRRDAEIQREAEQNSRLLAMEAMTGSSTDSLMKAQLLDSRPQFDLKPLDCISRLASFFSAPVVKFYLNVLSYFGFLLLFAYVLMIDFQTMPSWKEMLLYIWLISLVCEEVRQLFDDPDGFGFRRKAKIYINDLWNILDVLSILLFIAGFSCRLTTVVFYTGKVILCIDFIVFSLRLMAIFIISKTLGPKIIIVRRMMMDMFFFMFLLSIWVVAYGVAKQGILIDNEDRLNWILRGAVYEPYLTIFGNIPTSIDNMAFDISTCTLNGSNPLMPRCPVLNKDQTPAFPVWLTIILLCVYLLFANILLINLLIAIFNYTFQQVQDNTDCIWKFQRYELIKEYHSRPAPPPPFILLSHLYLVIRRLLRRAPYSKHQQFKVEVPQAEEEELLSWEALMKDNYLAKSRQQQSESMENRIQDTADKVGAVVEFLAGDQEQEFVTMMKRLTHLEEQASQSIKALQWIMNALKLQGYQPKEEAPLFSCDHDESWDELAKEGAQFHVNARLLNYPDSTVTRFPVPDEKVPWKVEFSFYDPPVYNAQRAAARRKSLQETVDSDSADLDNYRNPVGRTGMKGRGCLIQLGPNQIHEVVLTRWREGVKRVLQFLALWEESKGCWVLPKVSLTS
ncbi:transient receptor potential cation channel subfamily M member 2 [Scleropages formosus]|uniref:transient receptor potential cation channel subfamily M member 2 n=1 Tax=Scleropages formosus TaxID=113540 RepID=UPI0008789441|nr:transient receptor potential cation channel subfamily M member 2 [Scleropages formosus]